MEEHKKLKSIPLKGKDLIKGKYPKPAEEEIICWRSIEIVKTPDMTDEEYQEFRDRLISNLNVVSK